MKDSIHYNGRYCQEMADRIFLQHLEECRYFPKYFTIETCNNCNAQCVMCPKGQKGTGKMEQMTDALFEKIVLELAPYREWIEMICLNSDGEPLLDQKIAQRIRRLKETGISHVNISTNASLLTEEKVLELINSGLDDIRISIDGYTKDTYEKIRKGLKYDVVKANVEQLIRIRDKCNSNMSIRIRMVEMEENKGERTEWMAYWNRLLGKKDKVQLMPMHTWSGVIEQEQQSKISYYADKPCISVFSSFTINWDGKVQLCDSDIEQKVVLGDLWNESIKSVWTGQKMEQIRCWHANGERNQISICSGCDHWSRDFREIS